MARPPAWSKKSRASAAASDLAPPGASEPAPPLFSVKRGTSLRVQAIEQIRKAIITGILEPGSMHSEQAIAAKMSISRTPVREALLQLEREGLAEFVPQRGARIREFDPRHLAEVLELRSAIEGYCAAALASNRTSDASVLLERELERQKAIIDAGDQLAWVIANMEFHTLLVASLDNNMFNEGMLPLASHTMRIGFRMNARKERMKESLREHSALVSAIRRGDPEKARALAVEHLYVTKVLMKQMFDDLERSVGSAPGASGSHPSLQMKHFVRSGR
jgi:DNA-binding GntR family transcriptional regulator